jgi:hypothetical protein
MFSNALSITTAAVIVLASGGAALADHEPVLVVRGNPYVPVIMDGFDATGAVVFGERGLDRPGVPKYFEPGPVLVTGRSWHPSAYLPAAGHPPRLGRHEVEPPPGRRLPQPAASFYRSWGTESAPGPVTVYPPFNPPEVVVVPHTARRKAPYRR